MRALPFGPERRLLAAGTLVALVAFLLIVVVAALLRVGSEPR